MLDKPNINRNSSRVLRAVLITSVLLNFAVAGAVIGAHWRGYNPIKKLENNQRAEGSFYLRALDKKQRQDLGKEIKKILDKKMRRPSGVSKVSIKESVILLRSDTFDKEAFSKIMSEHAQKSNRRLALARELLLKYIDKMSFEDRSLLASRIEKTLK